jgi:hypothetical protein
VALATPVEFQGACYALNASLSTAEPMDRVVRELAPVLLALRERIVRALELRD